ncbi:MAG: YbgC/FadM family acyl-CoA thioesterase [Helicobacteraceae bacterium]
MQFRVYYEDTDCGGVVYHANYLKFCERARSEIFFKNGISPVYEGGHFMLIEAACKFVKAAFLGDMLEVKTTLATLKNASLVLRQEIFRNGELIFSADLKLAFIKENKPAKIPAQMMEFLKGGFSGS